MEVSFQHDDLVFMRGCMGACNINGHPQAVEADIGCSKSSQFRLIFISDSLQQLLQLVLLVATTTTATTTTTTSSSSSSGGGGCSVVDIAWLARRLI